MSACKAFQDALPRGLDAVTAEHARTCVPCAEALAVATLLRQAASEEPPRSGLPSANHLWWRARIIRDLVANESMIEHATRPSRWLQGIGLALLGLLAAFGLSWLTASLFGSLQTQVAAGSAPWRWLAGLLLAGTFLPLAGFTALWITWRES